MEIRNELRFMCQALQFPSLSDATGLMPWDPCRLDQWACEFARDPKAVHAARFILGWWNAHNDWECGTFNPKQALEIWDATHRRVFLELITADLSVPV